MSELKSYIAPTPDGTGLADYYLKSEADKVIAEKDEEIYNIKYSRDEWAKACNQKDKEIAELKEKLMPCLNGDCILTCEVVEKYGKENAELKRKLESVQASMYCDVVDANMDNRRLKRALWFARAERAIAEAEYWYGHTSGMYYIDAKDVPDEEDDPYKRVKDTTIGWYKTWMNVERKCRAKAKEYK